MKEQMPVVKETNDGKRWFADGKPLVIWVAGALIGLKGWWEPYVAGDSTRLDKMEEQGFVSDSEKGLFHPSTPELRVRDRDQDMVR